MIDCLFCKIINGDISADIVYQNDHVLAFNDISPQAPTHILIIPKKHIPTINALVARDAEVVGQLYLVAKYIAKQQGFAEPGYRVVMNCNEGAGQTVFHIHLHLLAQRAFSWPPG